ncbi:DUF2306 domain-containing protein [Maricaulis parjimensis]|uniref:DUF2306 domain-containing protein n=1 Tax=Maricaulis parjimensis TaxID=144023 RepID=UPI00193A0B9E|nr:DUF2306 domain-containing protein [Maricaulis parjimensis]
MNWNIFFSVSPVIQIHALAALAALVVGAILLLGPKGTLPHRAMGIVWALLMLAAAVSAFFIRQINDGGFSLIHIFVPLTLAGLVGLVFSVRRGAPKGAHRKRVQSLYFAALVIPGLLAFVPGRLMHIVVFGG